MIKLTNDKIVEQFMEKHGDRYDYSKVKYTNSKEKVIIICKEHGKFEQTANQHKQGNNCPKCKVQGFNRSYFKDKRTILYILKFGELYKIGITSNTIKERYKGMLKKYTILSEEIFEDG